MDPKHRIIKKYPNRRLYDTASSLYVTLDDVRQLVLDHLSFKVVDQRTGEDLTRSTLLQIISEQEDHGTPVFSVEILRQIIRMHGQPQHAALSSFLTESIDLFLEHQKMVNEQLQSLAVTPSLDPILATPITLTQLVDRNFSLWKKWQESLLAPLTSSTDALSKKMDPDGVPHPPSPPPEYRTVP